MKNRSLFQPLLILAALLWGCSATSDQNAANAQDVYDADTQTSEDIEGDVPEDQEENFEKPILTHSGELSGTFRCGTECEDGVWSHHFGFGARDHMASTALAKESWLYRGEYFVVDGYYFDVDVVWWLPSQYYVFALHEGRYLPIRYYHVTDDQFPSMEEIESWDEEEFSLVETIEREAFVPFNYTFVIPPWAFPETSAFNVQLIKVPVWRPNDKPVLIPKTTYLRAENQDHHFLFTIYYGSERYGYSSASIRDRQEEATYWEPAPAGNFVEHLNWMFLAPPTDIYNWHVHEWPFHAELGDVFDVPDQRITLEFYTGAGPLLQSYPSGQMLYYLLRNEEVIDMFLLEPPEFDFRVVDWETDRGFYLPIEVELTEDPAAFQLIAAPHPFEPHTDWHTFWGNSPVSSNALLLRYAPE